MKNIFISDDALADLNEGFDFYESQECGLGDYFLLCLRSDIDGLKFSAGIHRKIEGFYRLLSRVFPYGIFYTLEGNPCKFGLSLIYEEIPNGFCQN